MAEQSPPLSPCLRPIITWRIISTLFRRLHILHGEPSQNPTKTQQTIVDAGYRPPFLAATCVCPTQHPACASTAMLTGTLRSAPAHGLSAATVARTCVVGRCVVESGCLSCLALSVHFFQEAAEAMLGSTQPTAVVVDTSNSPCARLKPVPLAAVTLTDDFWAPRRRLNREVIIPSQYRLLEETGRLDNFRRAAGQKAIPFRGRFFKQTGFAVEEVPLCVKCPDYATCRRPAHFLVIAR